MNKKLLSVAVAAGLASSSAMAVDLNAGTGVTSLATENTVSASGSTIATGTVNNVTVNTGFSISDSTERYMRFDFTGATFKDNTALALAVDDSSGTGNASEVLSTGGAAKGNFVIYEVTASTSNTVGVANDAILTLPNLTVTDSSTTIGVTYRLYSSPVDAVNNNTSAALVTTSGNVATWTNANTTATTSGGLASAKIDVTAESKKWVNDTTQAGLNTTVNTIGDFTVTDATTAPINLTGTSVNSTVLQSNANLTVTGDFTYAQDLTSGAPDGTYTAANVFIDNVTPFDCATSNITASSLNATTAVLQVTNAAGRNVVCVKANGVSIIEESSYSGVYAPVENTGYTDADTALTLNTLSKNGSSTTLNLALTPGGVFKNWIRVNNTSNIAGDVFMTVYNDEGKSVTINLSDISGQDTNEVKGQASTSLIDIADIVAAATASDSTFAVADAPKNKLRVVVTGEFSSIAAQSITTSTDNTTFTTF